ncbi:cyclophilin-like fold protein [Campylobacter suis]|nr:cyclophilin-like fold protein [Campylobacter suis]
MKIILKNINGEFDAMLDDTPAAREFAKLLPLKLDLKDYAKKEKYDKLSQKLDISHEPKGTDGKIGELSYFAPWGNFVIYYGYQGYYEGIVRLGEILNITEIDQIAVDGEVIIDRANK